MADVDIEALKKLDELIKTSDSANPSRKQLLELIEAADLGDDLKEMMRKMVTGDVPQVFGGYGSGTLLAIVFVAIIFAVILFFGYKLYKSIKEKELRKEEKKKLKQMKKKK